MKTVEFFFVQGYRSFQKWNMSEKVLISHGTIDRKLKQSIDIGEKTIDWHEKSSINIFFQFFTYISIFRNKQWWKSRKILTILLGAILEVSLYRLLIG